MAYVGRGTDKISNIEILDAITFTDSAGPYNITKSATAFTPTSSNALVISIDGVVQSPGSYTISAATLTFDSVMASTSTMNFIYQIGTGLITEPSDDSVTAAKIATDAVTTVKIKDLNVTAGKLATDAVETAKIKDLNVTNDKIAAGTIDVTAKITGVVPTANLGSGSASSTTILYGDQTYKTEPAEYDDSVLQSNVAMLGFKVAVNGSLTRYNLVDQSIDEFYDTSGVDASASTNEVRTASGSNFYYQGGITTTPTATEDADDSGVDGDYTWYKWTSTGAGSYSQNAAQADIDYLVIAGGGAGGHSNHGGGGGAGGFRTSYSTSGGGASAESKLSIGSGITYTMTVGAGVTDDDGNDSSISGSDITDVASTGGGRGAGNDGISQQTPNIGGSGGGGTYFSTAGAAGTANQGYAGGTGETASYYGAGGGGGASAVGGNGSTGSGGNGGAGLASSITSASVTYAGGGGGSIYSSGSGGTGGSGGGGAGSTGAGTAGSANTGGGGGGSERSGGSVSGGTGGSGIIVLRRLTTTSNAADLTLQSTDVTAEATPTYGEFVTLIENASGTATLNTDIKGYVSRDSGVTFTQGTLVDEGTWGTNKQILGFHDLDISAQPAGTSMCYKIETLNQSGGSKETRIYASSIGWR